MTVPQASVTFSTKPSSSSPLLPAVIRGVAHLALPAEASIIDSPARLLLLTRCLMDIGRPICVKAYPRARIDRTATKVINLAEEGRSHCLDPLPVAFILETEDALFLNMS